MGRKHEKDKTPQKQRRVYKRQNPLDICQCIMNLPKLKVNVTSVDVQCGIKFTDRCTAWPFRAWRVSSAWVTRKKILTIPELAGSRPNQILLLERSQEEEGAGVEVKTGL